MNKENSVRQPRARNPHSLILEAQMSLLNEINEMNKPPSEKAASKLKDFGSLLRESGIATKIRDLARGVKDLTKAEGQSPWAIRNHGPKWKEEGNRGRRTLGLNPSYKG